jgi:glycosyltransferase involved in cell wall biosynthesis
VLRERALVQASGLWKACDYHAGAMRVLMIAPTPVFTPRGTPISVVNRCRALTALGHTVDLVTYPIGENVEMHGLRYLRGPRVPGIRSMKIGPSAAKVPMDALVFIRGIVRMLSHRYDVVHTHEEAGALGWVMHRLVGATHIYDMHNDLATVMMNYGFSEHHPLTRLAGWLELRSLRSARAAIVVIPDLAEEMRRRAPGVSVHLIENVPVDAPPDEVLTARLRAEWRGEGRRPLIVYTGTLEPYQGMPLLIEAMAFVTPLPDGTEPRLVVVGGRQEQIAELRELASRHGAAARVLFAGMRPPADMPACLAAADVLVSPRSSGGNTPLKIFAYMHSGRPVVATRIRSHTQVLDDGTAVLVEPDARSLAAGIDSVLADPARARAVGEAAARRAEERYSRRAFIEKTAAAYAAAGAAMPPADQIVAAARRLEALAA